jgi:DNA repair protein RecO (recombination protein O)
MESTDDTREIAARYGCKIVTFPKANHKSAEPARTFAIQSASSEWVLVVDADELVTPELRRVLYNVVKAPDGPAGYYIPRQNMFLGMFVRDFHFDYQLRFFIREGTEWPPYVHTFPKVQGRVERLKAGRDARLLHPFSTLTVEPVKISISLFLAEFLYHALRGEQQPDTGMFDYMKHSLLWLDEAKRGYANFHLAFLIHLSRFLGVGLLRSMTQEGEGLFFDLREGEYCDVPPLHQEFLRPEEASRINALLRMDYQNMHLFRLSHTERNRCLDVILAYYRLHLPAFPELKSLPVLQALFA